VWRRGLKLGLYSDIGKKTCAGYLGMEDNFDLDAQTFAEWEIDMLKVRGRGRRSDGVVVSGRGGGCMKWVVVGIV
jgi:hypothetical protein